MILQMGLVRHSEVCAKILLYKACTTISHPWVSRVIVPRLFLDTNPPL